MNTEKQKPIFALAVAFTAIAALISVTLKARGETAKANIEIKAALAHSISGLSTGTGEEEASR